MRDEIDGVGIFVAVAEAKAFRAAGERLGVSHSTVSQALRRLEERLGVTLVQRTTRSVRLTEADERLYGQLRPALEEVRAAVAGLYYPQRRHASRALIEHLRRWRQSAGIGNRGADGSVPGRR